MDLEPMCLDSGPRTSTDSTLALCMCNCCRISRQGMDIVNCAGVKLVVWTPCWSQKQTKRSGSGPTDARGSTPGHRSKWKAPQYIVARTGETRWRTRCRKESQARAAAEKVPRSKNLSCVIGAYEALPVTKFLWDLRVRMVDAFQQAAAWNESGSS